MNVFTNLYSYKDYGLTLFKNNKFLQAVLFRTNRPVLLYNTKSRMTVRMFKEYTT